MLPIPLPRSLVPALVAAAFLFPGAPASAQSNAATPVPAHHATTFRVLAFSTVDSAAVALAVPVQRTLERAIADDRTWMLVQPDSPQRADIIVSGSIRLVAQDSTSVTWRAI
jgi:hypothetical protein